MGKFVIKPTIMCWPQLYIVLVYLNIRMVSEQAADFFTTWDSLLWKVIIIGAGLCFITLMLIAIIYPLL